MKQLGWIICRTFIEKRKKESKSIFFSFLPSAEREIITNLAPPSQDLTLGFDLKTSILNWTHYSWILPFLRSFSEKDVCLFLSSLEKDLAQTLRKSLKLSTPHLEIPEIAQPFFREKIANFLLSENSEILPIQALPKSSLNVLLELSSEDLRLLIELLGLHDLALELKQIIDNVKLKKIYSIFPKEKEAFLKMLAHKQESVIFKRIEIARWDGKADSLLSLLFQRGLNRLAKALYPESPAFIWYITHRMDREEAQIFSSLCRKLEHPKAYTFLESQVLEALSFVRKIKPTGSS